MNNSLSDSVAELGEGFLEATIPGTSINVATGIAYGIVSFIAYKLIQPRLKKLLG